ncbi:alanyl-tRNA editing protein [Bacillus thermocopriae]|uniref:Alanyl-tRNA editing protein n=2 Tax=Neobacillus thermocopriae TaxID=1215031 RepID=A0A6B3TRU8_9BACI|nr:alanine--tRNA ligase-related protein [Neobacillus thermocopriae]MED3624550.1 alanine--tRNA ligase-related protein [Neobacillus thermocopriae]MED3712943.1 alanine--tRNA ligase-related protein [Neobacillus thermocopriae]NEX79130.1 alanyl-tRNA editing protein [Neobacillus thermocopriae]
MMENKLFYSDPYIRTFNAKVLKQEQDELGKWYVVLNQTAFYPTGGGQPFDTGMIDEQRVINVEEIGGEIRHYLDGPISNCEKIVQGQIDWDRRFDHMQQHAGQHILSAAFESLFAYKTVGFHLGEKIVTIDLETEQLTKEEAKKAEQLANQIILENRPIQVKWVTEQELFQYPLRKAPKVKKDIRLVIIPDFDYNGCGGTHPKTTGEVRGIKILGWERQKKKIRLQFVCGERVLLQLENKHNVLLSLTKLLNAPELELEQAAVRIIDARKEQEKTIELLQDQLLQYEAKELLSNGPPNHWVGKVFKNRTIQELQKLARFITVVNEASMAILVSESENRLQLVCARGAARTENMKHVIEAVLPHIGGKGGGNDSFAQGGGEARISGQELLEVVWRTMKIEAK